MPSPTTTLSLASPRPVSIASKRPVSGSILATEPGASRCDAAGSSALSRSSPSTDAAASFSGDAGPAWVGCWRICGSAGDAASIGADAPACSLPSPPRATRATPAATAASPSNAPMTTGRHRRRAEFVTARGSGSEAAFRGRGSSCTGFAGVAWGRCLGPRGSPGSIRWTPAASAARAATTKSSTDGYRSSGRSASARAITWSSPAGSSARGMAQEGGPVG